MAQPQQMSLYASMAARTALTNLDSFLQKGHQLAVESGDRQMQRSFVNQVTNTAISQVQLAETGTFEGTALSAMPHMEVEVEQHATSYIATHTVDAPAFAAPAFAAPAFAAPAATAPAATAPAANTHATAVLSKFCTECGTQNIGGAKFCGNCGTKFA